MRTLFALLVMYAISWLVAASFSFSQNVVKLYHATKTHDTEGGRLPELLALAPTKYRLSDQNVMSTSNGFISKYENCDVFDLQNWECSESNGEWKFGIRNGIFLADTPAHNRSRGIVGTKISPCRLSMGRS